MEYKFDIGDVVNLLGWSHKMVIIEILKDEKSARCVGYFDSGGEDVMMTIPWKYLSKVGKYEVS